MCKCERADLAGPLRHPDWARGSESLRVSWILLCAYIPRLFLTTHPLAYYSVSPLRTLRKHVWLLFLLTCGQIQTESKNDSIEARRPLCWKKNVGGCGQGGGMGVSGGGMLSRKGWHTPVAWHSQSWLRSYTNFRHRQTFVRKVSPETVLETFCSCWGPSTRLLCWISLTKMQLNFTATLDCHHSELSVPL